MEHIAIFTSHELLELVYLACGQDENWTFPPETAAKRNTLSREGRDLFDAQLAAVVEKYGQELREYVEVDHSIEAEKDMDAFFEHLTELLFESRIELQQRIVADLADFLQA